MASEAKIQRQIRAGSDELAPLDEAPASKTMAEVSAEHPEVIGLAQLVSGRGEPVNPSPSTGGTRDSRSARKDSSSNR